MNRRAKSLAAATAFLIGITACVPHLQPLSGTVAPERIPTAELPPGHRIIAFRWELEDPDMSMRGEGAARVAPPDSVRLDFFIANGFGHGAAILVDDSLRAPGPVFVRSLIPPAALLWAALGRLALFPLADTAVRVDGTVLRADIGDPVAWRITFHGDTLARLDRVVNGRLTEWVERSGGEVRYRREGKHRSLRLIITHVDQAAPFDASIWHLD